MPLILVCLQNNFWNISSILQNNGWLIGHLRTLINTGFLDFVHRPEFYN
jgi:hypothetical protein